MSEIGKRLRHIYVVGTASADNEDYCTMATLKEIREAAEEIETLQIQLEDAEKEAALKNLYKEQLEIALTISEQLEKRINAAGGDNLERNIDMLRDRGAELTKLHKGTHITEEQVRILWGALLLGRTLGERIIMGKEVLGIWPDDLLDDICPLCGRELNDDLD